MAYEAKDVRDVIVIVMVVSFGLGVLTGALSVGASTPNEIRVTVTQSK